MYHMRICKVENCTKIHFGLGYCNTHYVQFKKHGYTPHKSLLKCGQKSYPEYNVWKNMKTRCYNKNNNRFKNYGGRGITVCDRWKDSFLDFYKDMGKRPSMQSEIDRLDNDKGYYKSNCIWTTKLQNMRHTTRTVLTLDKANEIRTLNKSGIYNRHELAEMFNVSYKNIYLVLTNRTWKNNIDSNILYGIK